VTATSLVRPVNYGPRSTFNEQRLMLQASGARVHSFMGHNTPPGCKRSLTPAAPAARDVQGRGGVTFSVSGRGQRGVSSSTMMDMLRQNRGDNIKGISAAAGRRFFLVIVPAESGKLMALRAGFTRLYFPPGE